MCFNTIALRKAKIEYNFSLPECNRVKLGIITKCMILFQPLEEGQRTDTAWLKSTLREINHRIKDTDKKLLAMKTSIDEAKVNIFILQIDVQCNNYTIL